MIPFVTMLVATILQMALLMVMVITSYALTLYFLAFVVIAFRMAYDAVKTQVQKLVKRIVLSARRFTSREKKGNETLGEARPSVVPAQ